MGAVPKVRISTRRKGKRRQDESKNLFVPNLIKCRHCESYKKPHTVCKNCKKY